MWRVAHPTKPSLFIGGAPPKPVLLGACPERSRKVENPRGVRLGHPAGLYQMNVTRGWGQNLQMTPTNKNQVTDYGYDANGNLNTGGTATN